MLYDDHVIGSSAGDLTCSQSPYFPTITEEINHLLLLSFMCIIHFKLETNFIYLLAYCYIQILLIVGALNFKIKQESPPA